MKMKCFLPNNVSSHQLSTFLILHNGGNTVSNHRCFVGLLTFCFEIIFIYMSDLMPRINGKGMFINSLDF